MSNAIDNFVNGTVGQDMSVVQFEGMFEEIPAPLTDTEKNEWISKLTGVALGSDAFFPFRDNIDRARLVSSIKKKVVNRLQRKLLKYIYNFRAA